MFVPVFIMTKTLETQFKEFACANAGKLHSATTAAMKVMTDIQFNSIIHVSVQNKMT